MFAAILSWITGGGLNGLASQLRLAQQDKLNAANDEERIAAEVEIQQLQSRQQALISGKGAWISNVVQALFAIPYIVYNAKVIVWDKVLGLGVTDPLGPHETNLGLIIVGFYFLTVGVKSTIRQAKR